VAPLDIKVTEKPLGFENFALTHPISGTDRKRPGATRYNDYGVVSSSYAVEVDPADGKRKLRVTVTMARPDFWGGMFARDYTIRVGNLVKR
jgi:hypothetical protein